MSIVINALIDSITFGKTNSNGFKTKIKNNSQNSYNLIHNMHGLIEEIIPSSGLYRALNIVDALTRNRGNISINSRGSERLSFNLDNQLFEEYVVNTLYSLNTNFNQIKYRQLIKTRQYNLSLGGNLLAKILMLYWNTPVGNNKYNTVSLPNQVTNFDGTLSKLEHDLLKDDWLKIALNSIIEFHHHKDDSHTYESGFAPYFIFRVPNFKNKVDYITQLFKLLDFDLGEDFLFRFATKRRKDIIDMDRSLQYSNTIDLRLLKENYKLIMPILELNNLTSVSDSIIFDFDKQLEIMSNSDVSKLARKYKVTKNNIRERKSNRYIINHYRDFEGKKRKIEKIKKLTNEKSF